jgi:septal ring factor EnvC (AmiA/AmiB activator)
MIEHGKGVKSILLGDFLARVKKGNSIKQGENIGYTKLINKTQGTVYFEVRKKNTVQNTVFLLDKKYLKDQNYYKL